MPSFQWVVAMFEALPVVFGGLLMLAAFRFSNGPGPSRIWRALLGIFGALLIVFAALTFAFGVYALWIAAIFPPEPPYDPDDYSVTLQDYVWVAGICSGPLLVGIALCASAFRIARRSAQAVAKGAD